MVVGPLFHVAPVYIPHCRWECCTIVDVRVANILKKVLLLWVVLLGAPGVRAQQWLKWK
jgi:hypothetical protein